jgi:hypothetical protein
MKSFGSHTRHVLKGLMLYCKNSDFGGVNTPC